jgi:hypothetical protein
VQASGLQIGRLWRESLRYHGNIAYTREMTQVREATEWLVANADRL